MSRPPQRPVQRLLVANRFVFLFLPSTLDLTYLLTAEKLQHASFHQRVNWELKHMAFTLLAMDPMHLEQNMLLNCLLPRLT